MKSPNVADTPALAVSDLYRFYRAGDEETLALRGVSLTVSAGEVVAVVGPSGSGKSTLLACLTGIDEPSGGTVRVVGERLSHRPEQVRARLRAEHIGVMTQGTNLFAHLDVLANVKLSQRLASRADRQAVELLDSLGLSERHHARPETLSGGEIARASLAVAMANSPDILVADEPTGELDEDTERRVLALLRSTADSGTAVVVASHSPAVHRVADRILHLDDGVLTS